MDSFNIPEEIAALFPSKVALLNRMRAYEQDLKSYTKGKVINVKEDILRRGQKVKRMLKMLLEVD